MQWWEWVTWTVAIGTGVTGTILGVRSERRASKYSTLWVADPRIPTRFINRTNEDAANVSLRLEGAVIVSGNPNRPLIEAGGHMSLVIRVDEGREDFGWAVTWTRPADGKTYTNGHTRGRRLIRRLRRR